LVGHSFDFCFIFYSLLAKTGWLAFMVTCDSVFVFLLMVRYIGIGRGFEKNN